MTQVVALKPGFHGGVYRKIGDIFELAEAKVEEAKRRLAEAEKAGLKNKKPAFKVVTDLRAAKAEAEKVKRDAEEKQKQGAIAASGGKAAKDKVDAARDLAG